MPNMTTPPPTPPGGDDDELEDDAVRAERGRRHGAAALELIDLDEVFRNLGRSLSSFAANGALDGPARRKDFWDRWFALYQRAGDYAERLRDQTLN